jgi:hypothetical protein|tara:strand:+ start:835 stop:1746 length:912 start_codon:yes stop_codon:yes gene_type:complete
MKKGSALVGFIVLAVIVSLPDVARHTWEKTTGWFNEATAGDPFREEELEHWPGHPDAHPGYLDLRERVFELIPRVLYTAGQKEVDGIPITPRMVLKDRPYTGVPRPEEYNLWELIAEKKAPIYMVTEGFSGPREVVKMYPKDWDSLEWFERENGELVKKENKWRVFTVDVADPRSWSDEARARQEGDYVTAKQSLGFYVLLEESEANPKELVIKEIAISGSKYSGQANDPGMWWNYLAKRVNSPYKMPIFNGDAWHAASGWLWKGEHCLEYRSEPFCNTLAQNIRTFTPPGKKVEDLYEGLAN